MGRVVDDIVGVVVAFAVAAGIASFVFLLPIQYVFEMLLLAVSVLLEILNYLTQLHYHLG